MSPDQPDVEQEAELLDEILVLSTRQGKVGAFAVLVRRYAQRLRRHISRLVADQEVARDLVQDVWVIAVRDLDKLRDPRRLKSWLFTIATRQAVDFVRRKQRTPGEISDVVDDLVATTEAVSESVAALREALQHLAPDRRMLLELYYLEEFTVTDIAAILAVPNGTVQSRLATARRELGATIERLTAKRIRND